MSDEYTYFRVSSGIKDIVGRDLITDDFVAIFELVKNSFDALSTRVDIFFDKNKITVIDDGKGMSLNEIEKKWLFLGYSAKEDGQEDNTLKGLSNVPSDFRNRIKKKNVGFAGNKGIGRFSCDRLGANLTLSSRSVSGDDKVISQIDVNWSDFEGDLTEEFEQIPVKKSFPNSVELPKDLGREFNYGTVLEISNLRADWPRKKILSLKASLAKLVNPFGVKDDLQIYIHAVGEQKEDDRVLSSTKYLDALKDFEIVETSSSHIPTHYLDVVNGKVQNFIFSKISKYTTNISVSLTDDGEEIHSQLFDRGELILEFLEPNPYKELRTVGLKVGLHYLNTAARREFTRFMGQQSTQFGHVFLFNNGFRVFPIGEPRVDTFGLDRRKNQGRTRYLGTREVVGRIDLVHQRNAGFKEASSRNSGLINTPAFAELEEFFINKCVRLLERYVVNVSWVDKLDRERLDLSGMETDVAKARIIKVVSSLVQNSSVQLLKYSPHFLTIIDEKSSDFSSAMKGLEIVADKLKDAELLEQLDLAKKRQAELVEAQKKAQEDAEAERKARLEAEAAAEKDREKAEDAEQRAEEAEQKAKDAEKRATWFTAVHNSDPEYLVEYIHHAGTYSSEIRQHIELYRSKIIRGRNTDEDLSTFLERVELANSSIQKIVNFSTKANFVLDGEEVDTNLTEFIPQYVERICTIFEGSDLNLICTGEAKAFKIKLKPIELFIVIDSLVHNSKKAGANTVWFDVSNPQKGVFRLDVTDDGGGLDKEISDVKTIFKKGVTSKAGGSGLGLHHSKQLIAEMDGNIEAILGDQRELTFRIEFAK